MKENILKQLRISRQISQKYLAQIMGVSQQTIAGWEIGRTEPSNDTLCRIADYFNVSTDYLLGRKKTDYCNTLTKEHASLISSFDKLNNDAKQAVLTLIQQLSSDKRVAVI